MPTPISKYKDLDDLHLSGMITHAERNFPFLEHSSAESVRRLARLMIDVDYVVDRMPTPVMGSLAFLRARAAEQGFKIPERDFVFLIKMFSLRIRDKGGLLEFLPGNEWAGVEVGEAQPVEVYINDLESAKNIEYQLSAAYKPRKVHSRRIDAAENRLSRIYRDTELAYLFVDLVNGRGMTIGDARDVLRDEHKVKDHEYTRIRQRARELGIFDQARKRQTTTGRVTLDPDVMEYVEAESRRSQGPRMHARTPSQMVNQIVRDFYYAMNKRPLPPAASTKVRAGKVVKKDA